jgi:hypothetical protein
LKTVIKNKDHNAYCARCGKAFECRPNEISSCDCSKIELTKEEYRYISSRFHRCVCNDCLNALKNEYNENFHYNKPNNSRNRPLSVTIFFLLLLSGTMYTQTYAPPVGQPGTTAVYKDSSAFVSWASACTVKRGDMDLSNPALGLASAGDSTMATGKADVIGVVSLGDGGSAICTFVNPIKNGPGNDFAVFENSFNDVFLELAFVEVSSDGVNFFRFHANSLTDTVNQTGGFGSTDATKINNLAGKYRGGYGTPFDLQELSGTAGLDINRVTHVKIIDVVGSLINAYASRDYYHNKVNDPWTTPYPSSGFDLDAVGVMYENTITGIRENNKSDGFSIYPNPVNAGEKIKIQTTEEIEFVELMDQSGAVILKTKGNEINTYSLNKGVYFLRVHGTGSFTVKKLVVF